MSSNKRELNEVVDLTEDNESAAVGQAKFRKVENDTEVYQNETEGGFCPHCGVQYTQDLLIECEGECGEICCELCYVNSNCERCGFDGCSFTCADCCDGVYCFREGYPQCEHCARNHAERCGCTSEYHRLGSDSDDQEEEVLHNEVSESSDAEDSEEQGEGSANGYCGEQQRPDIVYIDTTSDSEDGDN